MISNCWCMVFAYYISWYDSARKTFPGSSADNIIEKKSQTNIGWLIAFRLLSFIWNDWLKSYMHYALFHYCDVIMGVMASQITSLAIVYSTVYSGVDQRKHKSSASLAFVPRIHRWPVNSPHKWPVTRKMFPFDDVIMCNYQTVSRNHEIVSCLALVNCY